MDMHILIHVLYVFPAGIGLVMLVMEGRRLSKLKADNHSQKPAHVDS